MLAVGANGTAIMAALPTMQTELFLSSAGVQWAVNAYLVVSAACVVLGGQAADRFGARLVSMVGLALFGVASCIIAAAGTQTELLVGRSLQGLAAAFAVPGTLAAVDTGARPERRAAASGAWTGFFHTGAVGDDNNRFLERISEATDWGLYRCDQRLTYNKPLLSRKDMQRSTSYPRRRFISETGACKKTWPRKSNRQTNVLLLCGCLSRVF
jgi:hypothetical protein